MKIGRFAPTPSGRMHIGNVYAMLAAWLSAHSNDASVDSEPGKVVLRIEDVDTARAIRDADRWIMDDLHWLGLDWDGEPTYQSQRYDLYEDVLTALSNLEVGDGDTEPLIYPCFCSRADLRALSAPQEGDRFLVYPGTCRAFARLNHNEVCERLQADERHSLRIAVPKRLSPQSHITFSDTVFGTQQFNLADDLGDVIVRRSDGLFSYQLAVVVDDMAMGVNDIVRGRDLLRSTACQIWIAENVRRSGYFQASAQQPVFSHLPLNVNADGLRLAKRSRSLDLGILRGHGVSPERIIGYCAWQLGILPPNTPGPVPLSLHEALELFSWQAVRNAPTDKTVNAADLW